MASRRPSPLAIMTLALVASLAATALPSRSRAGEPTAPLAAEAAFGRLKTLVGTWEQRMGDDVFTITYRLTGNGSAVVETFAPGTEMEMLSVYHLDGPALRMTHYCAVGNQPRMVLDRDASTPDELVFRFDGGTNLDPAKDMHVHEGHLLLVDAEHLTGEWTAYHDGQPAGSHAFELTRKAD